MAHTSFLALRLTESSGLWESWYRYPEMGKKASDCTWGLPDMTWSLNLESRAMQCLKCHFTSQALSYLKKKKKREGRKEGKCHHAYLVTQFWACIIVSRTCIWMHFCEWLCYKANEAQETIKDLLFYSHIWLWCMCWSMDSKLAVIWDV